MAAYVIRGLMVATGVLGLQACANKKIEPRMLPAYAEADEQLQHMHVRTLRQSLTWLHALEAYRGATGREWPEDDAWRVWRDESELAWREVQKWWARRNDVLLMANADHIAYERRRSLVDTYYESLRTAMPQLLEKAGQPDKKFAKMVGDTIAEAERPKQGP